MSERRNRQISGIRTLSLKLQTCLVERAAEETSGAADCFTKTTNYPPGCSLPKVFVGDASCYDSEGIFSPKRLLPKGFFNGMASLESSLARDTAEEEASGTSF